MTALVWIGAAITVAGLALLGWCIVQASRARRMGLKGTAMQARLRGLVALNLAALGLSGLGLAVVVIGVLVA